MAVLPRTPSLRRQVRVVFVVALALVAIGIAVGTFAFNRLLDARRVLVSRVDSAAVDTQRLLASLADQETGVRGFVLAGAETFLEPYTEGAAAESALVQRLSDELSTLPGANAAFEATRVTAGQWRTEYAIPTIAAIRNGEALPRTDAALAAGNSLFDQMRATFDTLDAALVSEQSAARHRLDTATYQLAAVLLTFGLIVVLGGGGVGWIFRRRIREPLSAIGADAREVSSGNLDHEVRLTGPVEFVVLGADIETMRRRIVDELAVVSAARAVQEDQTRALARSNAELEQFAYVASHDLQEPLRKVAAFCQLLQQRYGGQLDEKADQYIEFAVDGAKRMQALINDLLAFSRVGRSSGPSVAVDCNVAYADAVGNLAVPIDQAGARVTASALPTVQGELTLLTAVFQNLIGNAVKFKRPDVVPVVAISAAVVDDAWQFSVIDNGIGIDEQYAERVFAIFQRLHAKEDFDGTGIGLALCRKIVEDLGGRIWIEPPDGPGTTIRFTVPISEDPVSEDPISEDPISEGVQS